MHGDLPDLVKGAADQTQYANRLWITMIVVALVVFVPPSGTSDRALPLDLGTVPASHFYFFATLLLAILFIAFGAAHAQIMRTYILAQTHLAPLVKSWQSTDGTLHPRDWFDATVTPSLNRVGPLSHALRGVHQYYHDPAGPPQQLALLSSILYVYFKILAFLVYYCAPALALALAARGYSLSTPPFYPPLANGLVIAFLLGALVAFVSVAWLEVRSVARAARGMWRGGRSAT